jgi:hypothetical protein
MLKPTFIRTVTAPGDYHDDRGLYLKVSEGSTKSWVFRYMLRGQRHRMGLGPADTISLSEARTQRDAARYLVKIGVDPIAHRHYLQRQAHIQSPPAKRSRQARHVLTDVFRCLRAGFTLESDGSLRVPKSAVVTLTPYDENIELKILVNTGGESPLMFRTMFHQSALDIHPTDDEWPRPLDEMKSRGSDQPPRVRLGKARPATPTRPASPATTSKRRPRRPTLHSE